MGVKYPSGTYRSERHFLDFVVNGQSLLESVGKPDLVTVFCGEYAFDESIKAVNRLLLREKADLPDDRRSFFICGECGDLGCGAITALVVKQDDSIVWKDFGFENSYEKTVELSNYEGVGLFMFDIAFYENELIQAIDKLEDLKSSVRSAT